MPTEFQQKVYAHVRNIPTGDVHTYGYVAKSIGCPNSSRAVGSALRKNPYGPDSGCAKEEIVNCHRVVPATRKVGAYFGNNETEGYNIKRAKLEAEGVKIDINGLILNVRH